jgi:hypothetical protein
MLQNNWRTQPIRLRLVSWLCYGLMRFLIGMEGMPLGKSLPCSCIKNMARYRKKHKNKALFTLLIHLAA